jgi:hypothetical protein
VAETFVAIQQMALQVAAVVTPYLSLDLLAAPFIVAAYRLGRRGDPRQWVLMAVSNALLAATGLLSLLQGSKHLGLLIAAWLLYAGIRNFIERRRAAAA